MTASEAAEKLFDQLSSFPWLVSIGVAERDDGDRIYVYVKSLRHRAIDELKAGGFLGFPVVIDKTGTIRPAAKTSHVELIDPNEKLSKELGGTGYVGPKTPATPLELIVNAEAAAADFPELNMAVWKVLQSSVNWKKWAKTRRLRIGDRIIPCEVIGSTGDWWFVSVNATTVVRLLNK